MTDAEFMDALESCTLAPRDFGHVGHVRAAYACLQGGDFVAALERMRRAIRNYSAFIGKPDRYHETITVAYLALIHQCLHERGNGNGNGKSDGDGWLGFRRSAPQLFEPDLLLKFYSRSMLESELARKVFILPPHGICGASPRRARKASYSGSAMAAQRRNGATALRRYAAARAQDAPSSSGPCP